MELNNNNYEEPSQILPEKSNSLEQADKPVSNNNEESSPILTEQIESVEQADKPVSNNNEESNPLLSVERTLPERAVKRIVTYYKKKSGKRLPAKPKKPVTILTKKMKALQRVFKPKSKKPRKYRAGTIALRECKHEPETPDDIKDPDFLPPKSLLLSPSHGKVKTTRGDSRIYFNCANSLPVLAAQHIPDDEAIQYRQFRTALELTCSPEPVIKGHYYKTDHAAWVSTIVRYKNKAMRDATISQNEEKEFWTKNNGCPSTIALEIRQILRNIPTKPICVMVGHQEYRKTVGHCLTVVIVPTKTGRKAIIKDCNSITEARVKTLVYKLLQALSIHIVHLVGMLKSEEHVINTECMREAYKVIGDVLDGNFFWKQWQLGSSIKTFDAKCFQLIAIQDNVVFDTE